MPTQTQGATGVPPAFTDVDVAAAVSMRSAVDALRNAFLAAYRDRAHPIAKTMRQWEDGTSSAHALGGIDLDSGFVGFKCWVNTPRGAHAVMTLFDAESGQLCATFAAAELGMLRTAATAALATDSLAAPDAEEMALLGTGRQAFHQVLALCAVRRIKHVHIWSPRPASRRDFSDRLASELDVKVTAHDTWAKAVSGIPIVTTVTRASVPFIEAGHLATGAHLNAVGAILPTNAELLPSVVQSSDLIVVDDLENARRASAELRILGDGLPGVSTLGALLARDTCATASPRLTLYKGLGSGVADVAIAATAYRHHTERF